MVSAPGTWAAPPNVPGQPFQQLQDQIDQLSADVATLTSIINNLGNSAVTGTGVDGFLPLWNGTQSLEGSAIFQSASGNVGIGTMAPTVPLQVEGNVKVSGAINVGNGSIQITEDRIIFSDDTEQTTAFFPGSGGGGGVASDDTVTWTGTHTWKTDAGPGSGKTLETFSTTIPPGAGSQVLLTSISVPNNTGLLIHAWGVQVTSSGQMGTADYIGVVTNVGGVVEENDNTETFEPSGDLTPNDYIIEPNGSSIDVSLQNSSPADTVATAGWIEYFSVPLPIP